MYGTEEDHLLDLSFLIDSTIATENQHFIIQNISTVTTSGALTSRTARTELSGPGISSDYHHPGVKWKRHSVNELPSHEIRWSLLVLFEKELNQAASGSSPRLFCWCTFRYRCERKLNQATPFIATCFLAVTDLHATLIKRQASWRISRKYSGWSAQLLNLF
jgi:hypothetical protein